MKEAKQKKEEPIKETTQGADEQKVPLGLVSRTDSNALLTFQQLFDILRVAEAFSNLVLFLKNENLNKDLLRYYFEEDLVEAKDEKGNPILQDGKPQKTLRSNFWDK